MDPICFYCGINETKWNYHPVAPGSHACISPVYGQTVRTENRIKVPKDCDVIQDSGAFCDGPGYRLAFDEALERQIVHASKYDYETQITHRASYDLLIDEKWDDAGVRHKRRWTVKEADRAVEETVDAAYYLSQNRSSLNLILSAQGVDYVQYLDCVKDIITLFTDNDILGLGGWCISGKMPKQMMPEFKRTISTVIPYVAQCGIKAIHIWGVLYAPALGELLWMCDQHNLSLSTDSAGPQLRPCFGEWGYMGWRKPYKRPPVTIRGLERAHHVIATRKWLSGFRNTPFYKSPHPNFFTQLTYLKFPNGDIKAEEVKHES